jgi:hypothetical protein
MSEELDFVSEDEDVVSKGEDTEPPLDDEEQVGEKKPEKAEEKEPRRRPDRRERGMERVFSKLSGVEKALGSLPKALERIEALEAMLKESSKRSDPKPRLSDFDTTEEYEAALEAHLERNPKPKAGDEKKPSNETHQPSDAQIAEQLGVTLETLDDFREQVEEAREEFEDYDEVMEESRSLIAAHPTLAKALVEYGDVDGVNGPKLTYHLLKDREGRKEYRRIAALPRRERDKALDAVAESLGKPASDRDDSHDKQDKGDRPFKPVSGRRAPGHQKADESTMSSEEFFALEEKRSGRRR